MGISGSVVVQKVNGEENDGSWKIKWVAKVYCDEPVRKGVPTAQEQLEIRSQQFFSQKLR